MDVSVQPLILQYGLPLVALMLFAGEIGIPTLIPMEIALLMAGAYTIGSLPELVAGLALVTVADFAGTTVVHLVARTGGTRILRRLLRHHEARQQAVVERWRHRLGGHDVAVVFIGRLLPLVRMYISIGLGLLRIPVRHFLLGAAPAALVWAGTPLALGYFFRSNVQALEERYVTISHVLVLALPLVSMLSAVGWWVCGAPSFTARVGRVRVVLGLVAAGASVAFLIKLLWAHERASDRGLFLLPLPVLIAWLALLAALAVALLWQAVADVHQAYTRPVPRGPLAALAGAEVATTLLWLGLVCLVGLVIVGLEHRYPAL